MVRLIDESKAHEVLTEYYHHRTYGQAKALAEALSRVPTVDAIPVEWLKKEMCEMYRLESVAKNEETKRLCHNEALVIEALIDDWREADGTDD